MLNVKFVKFVLKAKFLVSLFVLGSISFASISHAESISFCMGLRITSGDAEWSTGTSYCTVEQSLEWQVTKSRWTCRFHGNFDKLVLEVPSTDWGANTALGVPFANYDLRWVCNPLPKFLFSNMGLPVTAGTRVRVLFGKMATTPNRREAIQLKTGPAYLIVQELEYGSCQ